MTLDELVGLRPTLRRVLSRPAPAGEGGLPGLGGPPPSRYAFSPDPALRAERVEDTAALMAVENAEGAKVLRETDVFGAIG